MGTVRGHRADRNVHGEFLAVAVKNPAPLCRNNLLSQVFLRGKLREIIVLQDLQVNEPPSKGGEDQYQQGANHADAPRRSFHLLRTRWDAPVMTPETGSREAVRKIPSGSAETGGVMRATAVSRTASR